MSMYKWHYMRYYQFALSFQSLKYEPLFQNLDFDQIYHQTIQPFRLHYFLFSMLQMELQCVGKTGRSMEMNASITIQIHIMIINTQLSSKIVAGNTPTAPDEYPPSVP